MNWPVVIDWLMNLNWRIETNTPRIDFKLSDSPLMNNGEIIANRWPLTSHEDVDTHWRVEGRQRPIGRRLITGRVHPPIFKLSNTFLTPFFFFFFKFFYLIFIFFHHFETPFNNSITHEFISAYANASKHPPKHLLRKYWSHYYYDYLFMADYLLPCWLVDMWNGFTKVERQTSKKQVSVVMKKKYTDVLFIRR